MSVPLTTQTRKYGSPKQPQMLRGVQILDAFRLCPESDHGESWAEVAPRESRVAARCATFVVAATKTRDRVRALQELHNTNRIVFARRSFAAQIRGARPVLTDAGASHLLRACRHSHGKPVTLVECNESE
jgi:hypothetical protein